MNQQFQINRVPSYAAEEWRVRGNSFTSPQWSPNQSPLRSNLAHPEINSVVSPEFSPMSHPSPQFSPMCHPSPQFLPMCHPSPQFSPMCHPPLEFLPMCHPSNQNMSATSGPKLAGSMGKV